MNTRRFWRLAGLSAAVATTFTAASFASKTVTETPGAEKVSVPKQESGVIPPGFTAIATIPTSSDELVILAETAVVEVKRDSKAAAITLASNCPRDWNVNGSVIRQAGFCTPHSGISMKADALGSRAIVNGKIYPLPVGPVTGGFKMTKDGVEVAGKTIDPLQGVDLPGNCDGTDSVLLIVPDTYVGGLVLGAAGNSQLNLSSWKSGSVKLTLLGSSMLNAGKLSDLSKAVIDMQGSGKVHILDVSAKFFVANVSGEGSLAIDHGSSEMSNATVAGTGTIEMHGTFRNLKQSVVGSGSIKVN